jgi:hypothetical protein
MDLSICMSILIHMSPFKRNTCKHHLWHTVETSSTGTDNISYSFTHLSASSSYPFLLGKAQKQPDIICSVPHHVSEYQSTAVNPTAS